MGDLFEIKDEAIKEIPSFPQLPDQGQREKALDIAKSWIVEAPAGSGKTSLLIQRYLKLLSLPDVEQPEQILGITFTVKATGEIRERITELLECAAQRRFDATNSETQKLAEEVYQRDLTLGWKLLDHPRRLNIRTIDSICAEIARGLPLLSGGSGLSPIKDSLSLYRLAAERTLMQLGGEDTALSKALSLVLLHRDGNLIQTRDLLAEMLSLRDQWGRLIPLDRQSLTETFLNSEVLPQLESALAGAICTDLEHLLHIFPRKELEALTALAGEMGFNEGYNGEVSPIALCSGKYKVPGTTAADLDHWRALTHLLINRSGDWRIGFNNNIVRFATTKEQKKSLREITDSLAEYSTLLGAVKRVAALPPEKYPQEQWNVAKALFQVLYFALAELQIVFAERGECDFTEMGLLARVALRHGSGTLDTVLGLKLQHMLVDEMQDTSTSQYELIELLTQGWDGKSQTVFLVGDPKQSIYLFRQARVERFIHTMKELSLGDLRLNSLLLTSNFRSQAGLVRSFNEDFSRIFSHKSEDARLDEAAYTPAHGVRPSPSESTCNTMWHPQVASQELLKEDRRRLSRYEAQTVRHIIEMWRAKPLPYDRNVPWRIAVLVRNRSHLTQIVAELKRRAIPFHAIDIEPLGERPEVLDLFALTRALLHPADRVAWLAVFRAPWCGLELAELHKLCGTDDPEFIKFTVVELIDRRGQDLSEDSITRLQRLWPILIAATKQRSRLPLSELVERTWRSLGGNTYLSEEETINAKRYFRLLDEAESESAVIDLSLLKQRLSQLYAAPSSDDGAVDLMTIHGAKGLEWDVVLVPGLEKRIRSNRARLLAWEELSSHEEEQPKVVFAPIVGKGRDSEALNEWLKSIHKRRDAAECKRLFYVACTRAREELHLFATLGRRSDQSIRPADGSLLDAAWPAAERHFVDSSLSSKPLTAPVITLPLPPSANPVIPNLAAEEEEPATRAAILYRLPHNFQPRQSLPAITNNARIGRILQAIPFERPDGSFDARMLGNAMHAFLEVLARKLSTGISAQVLLNEIESWQPRIEALLRNFGLSSSTVQRTVPRVQHALTATLRDPQGLWILQPHEGASSEKAFTSWGEARMSVRLDRIFEAGEAPLFQGNGYLWIIDFKTAQYSGSDVDEFLKKERDKYLPQMSAYAEMLLGADRESQLKMGLYYPMIQRLIWWDHKDKVEVH
jgi:ATP-dependent exoDNAse (exonuclease V) beta subunit